MLLLDTNVVSELRKVRNRRADPTFIAWALRVDDADFYISVATVQEIEFGVLRLERTDPTQGAVLRSWFSESVLATFRNRILVVDTAIAQRCAYLHTVRTHAHADAQIAATAYVHNMPVVTRNVSHFLDTGVRVINPWQL